MYNDRVVSRALRFVPVVLCLFTAPVLADEPKDTSSPPTRTDTYEQLELFARVLSYVEIGRSTARLTTGGAAPERPGWFVAPTVFTDVDNAAVIALGLGEHQPLCDAIEHRQTAPRPDPAPAKCTRSGLICVL